MRDLASVFPEHLVTGNILLGMKVEDLLEVGFKSRLRCKWFLEQVRKLRCRADVSAQDRDGICKWLTAVSKDLEVYKVDFVQRGITKDLLPHLTEEILVEIGVCSAVDRLKVLLAIEKIPEHSGRDTPDSEGSVPIFEPSSQKQKYDVFVSYRRATGSQLASLLKVHLQLKGLSVFLDVAGLGSGKFDKALLTTISNSHNMLLVLTPQSLERCFRDTMVQDWVHREILCALESKVHIVPVMDPLFKWPEETALPEDVTFAGLPNSMLSLGVTSTRMQVWRNLSGFSIFPPPPYSGRPSSQRVLILCRPNYMPTAFIHASCQLMN